MLDRPQLDAQPVDLHLPVDPPENAHRAARRQDAPVPRAVAGRTLMRAEVHVVRMVRGQIAPGDLRARQNDLALALRPQHTIAAIHQNPRPAMRQAKAQRIVARKIGIAQRMAVGHAGHFGRTVGVIDRAVGKRPAQPQQQRFRNLFAADPERPQARQPRGAEVPRFQEDAQKGRGRHQRARRDIPVPRQERDIGMRIDVVGMVQQIARPSRQQRQPDIAHRHVEGHAGMVHRRIRPGHRPRDMRLHPGDEGREIGARDRNPFGLPVLPEVKVT